jgi:hypothetical protein
MQPGAIISGMISGKSQKAWANVMYNDDKGKSLLLRI